MGRRPLFVVLLSMCLVASCFRPLDQRQRCEHPCTTSRDCPSGLICLVDNNGGLCGEIGDTCHRDAGSEPIGSEKAHPDSSADVRETIDRPSLAEAEAGIDTGPDRPDGQVADPSDGGADVPTDAPDADLDADASTDVDVGLDIVDSGLDGDVGDAHADAVDGSDGDGSDAGCHNEIEPPLTPCWNGHCFTLPQTIRDSLVLWLDPSNLGAVGSSVPAWCDQSGQLNDAFSLSDTTGPTVAAGGGVMLDYNQLQAAMIVYDWPTLDFGTGDFTVLVVAGFSHGERSKTFFRKSSVPPAVTKQVTLEWTIATPPDFSFVGDVNETTAVSTIPTGPGVDRLYTLRRIGDTAEIRVNGNVANTTPLVTSGASTDNSGDLYLGARGDTDKETVDTIRAVIMIQGTLANPDLGALEAYLLAAFGLS